MKKRLPGIACLFLMASFFLLTRCVDSGYDLSDLDTDKITIGTEIHMPLGRVVIEAAQLFESDDIQADENGDFSARYGGQFTIENDSSPEIEDDEHPLGTVWLDNGGTHLSLSSDLPLPHEIYVNSAGKPLEAEIDFNTSSDVAEIREIIFRHESNSDKPRLTLEFRIDGIWRIVSGSIPVTIWVELPSGFVFDTGGMPYWASVSGDNILGLKKIFTSADFRSGYEIISVDLPLLSASPSQGVELISNVEITFTQGSRIDTDTHIQIDGQVRLRDLAYSVIYGEFHTDFSSEVTEIDMKGLNDIFVGDENHISFVNPYILFRSRSNVGIPLIADISLDALNEDSYESIQNDIEGIAIIPPAYYPQMQYGYTWIGESSIGVPTEYNFIFNDKLNDQLAISPTRLYIQSTVYPGSDQSKAFFPHDPDMEVEYELVVPLAPDRNFRAVMQEKLEDLFDDDLKEYMFSGGRLELFGTVTNSTPLEFDLELIVTDSEEQPVGIELDKEFISSCSANGTASRSDVSFVFTEADMNKMDNAVDGLMQFTARGTQATEGISLNASQQILMDLKIRKMGGITIKD